jgi:glycosyltransferase involved in cell wall biosynthesis
MERGAPRVMLFTDTLGDVNGVSRFIRAIAAKAEASGRELEVVTSTRFDVPSAANIRNFEPMLAGALPGYGHLEIVLPPIGRMLRHVRARRPDVVHVSTPGPVGLVGRFAARRLGVPVLGVYHTDFPAYVDRLFEERAYTAACTRCMRGFYRGFRRVFTRSAEYTEAVAGLGVARERIVGLRPGIETARFSPRFRDEGVWGRIAGDRDDLRGLGAPAVKVLSVGRVSVEKNLAMLADVWRRVRSRCGREGVAAHLVIVGDGPYRERMRADLCGADAFFLGFKEGEELSAIYATSDLFVFPSVTDTLGQVAMESQASGVPVLVSDRGGPKEMVREGETGFVLPAGDRGRWVETIVGLVGDRALRRRMGLAAAELMRGFDIQESFEQFWRVHEEAWRECGSRGGAERGRPVCERQAAASASMA